MDNKEELLQQLREKIEAGEISYEDVKKMEKKKGDGGRSTGLKILYIIGGIILGSGILALFSEIWHLLGFAGQVAISFGLGLMMTAIGSILLNQKSRDTLGVVFHVIGAVLIPLGIALVLNHLDLLGSTGVIALISTILFISYLSLAIFHKKSVLTALAVFYGVYAISLCIQLLADVVNVGPFLPYFGMIVCLSFLLLSYQWQRGWNRSVSPLLSVVGSAGLWTLIAIEVMKNMEEISLYYFSHSTRDTLLVVLFFFLVSFGLLFFNKMKDFYAAIVSVVFLAISLGIAIRIINPWFFFFILAYTFYLSNLIKSRAILFVGSIFLISFIWQLTSQYFFGISWPIFLILMGFIILAIGRFSINISKKYINS